MNPYQFSASCDVCGGDGITTSRGVTAAWTFGGFLHHSDPRICADVLAERQRKAEAEAARNRWSVPS